MLFVLAGPQLGAVFCLEAWPVIIGRDPGVGVQLADDTVSARHAILTRGDQGVRIEDSGSRNGTYVNGEAITGRLPLVDGDRVRVGTSNILKLCMLDELEQRALATLSELTLLDPLTRLHNRRYFDRRLSSELSFAARHGLRLAVLMIDIDRFKAINDARGHRIGDLVLKLVARTLTSLMRPEDVLARLGGDEFVVIVRDTSPRNVEILGQRICKRIAAATASGHEEQLQVSVSVGAALLDAEASETSADVLVASADRAMYRAKSGGRDRVVVLRVTDDDDSPASSAGPRTTRPPPG